MSRLEEGSLKLPYSSFGDRYMPKPASLGRWPYAAGDTLLCYLVECDGSGGCDPAKPNQLPNITAGDDLLGAAVLPMSSFKVRCNGCGRQRSMRCVGEDVV